jgi:hypothetical protein
VLNDVISNNNQFFVISERHQQSNSQLKIKRNRTRIKGQELIKISV